MLTAIPVTLASIACWIFLPESPRWLMVKNRKDEAETVLRSAATSCGVNLGNFILVKEYSIPDQYTSSSTTALSQQQSKAASQQSMRSYSQSNEDSNHYHYESSDNINTTEIVKEYTYLDLFTDKSALKISIPLWIIWFVFGVTYYGLVLFVNRLYTVNDTSDSSTTSSTNRNNCVFDYPPIFFNAIAEILGVFIATLVVDRWGRIRTQQVFFTLAGVAAALMGMGIPPMALTLIAVIGRMSIMGACVSFHLFLILYVCMSV